MKMKYIFTFLLVMFLSATGAKCQTYAATYMADIRTTNGPPRSGETMLHFSDSVSTYFHPSWPVETSYQGENVITVIRGDRDKLRVYTDLKRGVQVYDCHMYSGDGGWIFTEMTPNIDWTVRADSIKEYQGLSVVFATGHYGGRDYEAWFTPQIPYPVGPYRFGGLPGLIVTLNSTDDYVNYELLRIEEISLEESDLALPKHGEPITMNQLKNKMIKRLLVIEANSPPEWNDTQDDPPLNYDIEKGKWNFFSTFKANRGW